jgi:pectate lyase
MKKILLSICVTIIVTFSSFAQSAASSVWNLTANQSATITGNISAPDQQLSNMQVSYSGGVQRSSPTPTAGTWPAESVENLTRYMQFAVLPANGFNFSADTIRMILYVNSGSSMKANVYYSKDFSFTSRTQIGSTYSLSTTVPSSPNISAIPNVTVNSGETLYVRIYPWYTAATSGKYTIAKSVTVSGTATSMNAVFASVTDLNGFYQADATPSALQSYTLTGTNLTNDVIVTPPLNFEVSTDAGSTWHNNSSPITLPQSGGIITGQPVTVSVRMNASGAGVFSDTIKHTSSGSQQSIVTVSGTRIATEPTVISTVSIDTATITGNSMVVNFTGGNGAKRVVIARKDNAVNWAPTDGVSTLGISSDFSAALNQGNGNKAVYDGAGNSVTVTGLISNAVYYFAVYEYNTGNGNSQNYLTSSAGTAFDTTLKVANLQVDPGSLAFGSGVINKDTITKSYSLSGIFLTGSGYITISVPAGGFAVSLSGNSGFSTSVLVPYSAGTLNATLVYVRFIPTTLGSYADNVTNSGGGANTVLVPLSGKGISSQVDISSPVGFASLAGGTTGGAGGDSSMVITDVNKLVSYMKYREKHVTTKMIIYISGTLTGYTDEISCKYTKNISFIGLGSDAGFLGFGIKIWQCSNIIVRNLKFADCTAGEGDGISVDADTNVWADHCTFTDSPSVDVSASNHDGELDCKDGSFNVTISYNHFMNHRKTCLLGHTTDQTSDTVMKVTYYRNWFDGTYSRHPRVRFAKAHLLNNLYSGVVDYGVGVTCIAQVALESNYFENTTTPVLISGVNDPTGVLSHDPAGYIKSTNNCTTSSGSLVENLSGYNFDPHSYYDYVAGDCSQVKSIVTENAGSGIININPNSSFDLSLTALIEGLYSGTSMIPDTVTVELHDATSPYNVVSISKGLLDANGHGSFNFSGGVSGTPYYLNVKHRSAIETWSALPVSILTYDFTTTAAQAYGNNLIQIGSKWCLYGGDVNQDGGIDLTDLIAVSNDNLDGTPGIFSGLPTDVNGDGGVELSDLILVANNNIRGVYSQFVSPLAAKNKLINFTPPVKKIK